MKKRITQSSLAAMLAATLAGRLRASREELTMRWLERISARVTVVPSRIFPTEYPVDRMTIFIDGIADFVEDPASAISAHMLVIDKARELGALRYRQGFDQFEILKEFELLGCILLTFIGRAAEEVTEPCGCADLVACSQRVFQAVHAIEEATTTQYLQLAAEKIAQREERLRAFNRAITHEFRNRMGASLGAAEVLEMKDVPEDRRCELVGLISRNTRQMQLVLDDLLELARLQVDPRQNRCVLLPQAAAEAVRQLREMADAHHVSVRVAVDVPEIEVNAAAVELCLTNFVSNAIKYADPAASVRWVEVRARLERNGMGNMREVVVEVADNGRGVPANQRDQLFERFFRADNAVTSGIGGTGIGLSIVREAVSPLDGRVWAEFPERGSIFAFSLPCRRASDTLMLDRGYGAAGVTM